MKTKLSVVAAALCAIAACNPNEDLESARSIYEAPAPVLPSATSVAVAELTGIVPSTPAGDALAWTIERLNLSPEATTEEAMREAFDASVLERVSATSLAAELQRLGGHRPFGLIGFVEPPTETRIVAALMSRNGFDKLTVEVGASGRLTTVLFEELPRSEGAGATVPSRTLPFAASAPAAAPSEGSGAPAPEGSDAAPAAGSGEAAAE